MYQQPVVQNNQRYKEDQQYNQNIQMTSQQQRSPSNYNSGLQTNYQHFVSQVRQSQNPPQQQQSYVQQNYNPQLSNVGHSRNQSQSNIQQQHGQQQLHTGHGHGMAHRLSYQQHEHNEDQHFSGDEDDDYEEFEALKIPPNFNEASEHAESRKTGQVDIHHHDKKFCRCCGYQVQRKELVFLEHGTQDLKFLGSGFPLFYNFIRYCIIILLTFICISGIYNLYTNYQGHFCDHSDHLSLAQDSGIDLDIEKEMKTCHKNFAHTFSIINKQNAVIKGIEYNTADEYIPTQHILNLVVAGVVMVILMLFRRSQVKLDAEIDDEQCTPSDFTVIVKNIPKGLDCDYEEQLRHIFTHNVVRNERGESIPMNVTKINLVYNIDHVIELEEQLNDVVKKKQEFLIKNGFRTDDPVLDDWDNEIEHIEHRIHKIEHNIPKNQKNYFSGTAFISFMTEQEKDQVVEQNTYTSWEKSRSYFNNGELPNFTQDDLIWEKNKLFVEEAPEADDVDWEFIHIETSRKIKARIIAWIKTIVFLTMCYLAIWAVTEYQSEMIETVYEQLAKREVNWINYYLVKALSFSISMLIVLFNKFVLGKVFHIIVDEEYYSTKTKFNIAFAFKLTIGLFVNSALLTYFVEILSEKNFWGPGGFIYTETWVFIWNALVPPTVWLIDPWTIIKNKKRKQEIKKAQEGNCFLTQQEANILMEKVDYTQGKRYADIMKTMWFTFFYAPAIPLGLVFSLLNLIYYYYIDQYNVFKKRTIKETLSKEVSIEMIENLELCIIFYAIGNITFSIELFGDIDMMGIILFIVASVYAFLPMQEINEFLFPVEKTPERRNYYEAEKIFITDYDRQNPITKKAALKKFQKIIQKENRRAKALSNPSQQQQQHQQQKVSSTFQQSQQYQQQQQPLYQTQQYQVPQNFNYQQLH